MGNFIQSSIDYFTNLSGMQIVAQVFGFIVIIFNYLIFQQKERKQMLKAKRRADWCAAFSYFLFVLSGSLLAWASVFQCLIASFRETVFLNKEKKWASSKLWLVGFLVLFYASSFVTWALNKDANYSVWLNFLPAIASSIAIISYWIGNPRLNRVLQMPTSLLMLIYEINIMAVASLITEVFTIVSVFISIIRFEILNKSKKKAN
ncbi:MAG: YgjV family protein [Clostridia bacterium]|nr:YgjV family protein [Clostridia bacterium]